MLQNRTDAAVVQVQERDRDRDRGAHVVGDLPCRAMSCLSWTDSELRAASGLVVVFPVGQGEFDSPVLAL